MKSLAELEAIRQKTLDQVNLRREHQGTRVVVGMATCGIAAGARPVLSTFVEEVNGSGIGDKVSVEQTGCIGICQYEPVVEIFDGDEKTTYVKMTADKAKRVVAEHLVKGNVVTEYTIGAAKV